MRSLNFPLLLCLLAVATMLATYSGRASPARDKEDLTEYPYSEMAVEFAQASLRLAEAELAEAVEQDKQRPDSISEYDLERRKLHVEFAQQQLSDARQGKDYSHQIVGYMKLQLRLAELDLISAQKLQAEHPELMSDAKVEKLRSYAALCRVRLKIYGTQISPLNLVDHLHWETHRLSEEIVLLNRRLESLEEVSLR